MMTIVCVVAVLVTLWLLWTQNDLWVLAVVGWCGALVYFWWDPICAFLLMLLKVLLYAGISLAGVALLAYGLRLLLKKRKAQMKKRKAQKGRPRPRLATVSSLREGLDRLPPECGHYSLYFSVPSVPRGWYASHWKVSEGGALLLIPGNDGDVRLTIRDIGLIFAGRKGRQRVSESTPVCLSYSENGAFVRRRVLLDGLMLDHENRRIAIAVE